MKGIGQRAAALDKMGVMADSGRRALRTDGPTDGGSLESQLLAGLAVLIVTALVVVAAVVFFWLPLRPSPGALLLGLGGLILLDTGLIVLFGVFLLRKRVLDQVDRMVSAAESIAGGDDSRRLEVQGPDEFQRLAGSVNRMADNLIRNQRLLAENVRSLDETNRELSEARRELVQADKLASVGRLAAGVAHEVGNPLGAIIGYVEVARRRGWGDDEWLDEIEREAGRIHRVVRGLLDFARPHDPIDVTVDVNALAEQTVDLLESQGRLKGVEVRLELSRETPAVRADGGQLEQVLVNLLLNATDAIEEAGAEGVIVVRTAAETYEGPVFREPARRKEDPSGVDYSHLRRFRTDPAFTPPDFDKGSAVVRLEVDDNGVGLQPGEEERVFEPFYTTKEPGKGTGLGLAVSARIVEELGGVIRVSSTPGEGTRFAMILPSEAAR